MTDDVVYFELNNWFAGDDYPAEEPFISWMGNDLRLYFCNDDQMKAEKLCVKRDTLDMSANFCITAPRSWVEEHCPKLLTDYKQFVSEPEYEGDIPTSKNGYRFLEYCPENFGITWASGSESFWDNDCDDDEDDDDNAEWD